MGRRTYEGFAPVWPTRSGDPLSDHINAMDKYVATSTLKDPEWNNTTAIVAIEAVKAKPGGNTCSTASVSSPTHCWTTACWTSCGYGCTHCWCAAVARRICCTGTAR